MVSGRVVDARTGVPVYSLYGEHRKPTPDMLADHIDTAMPFMPVVQRHDGQTITFTLEPSGAGGWFEAAAFTWDGQTFTPASAYTTFNADYLIATGETAWLPLDESRLAPPAEGQPQPSPYHTLLVAPPDGEPYPIFAQDEGLHGPTFINNGRQIAVRAPAYGVIAISRDGAQFGLPVSDTAAPLDHAPLGYGFLEIDISTMQTRYILHQLVNNSTAVEATVLWHDESTGWTPVWSAPVGGMPDLPPFPPIAQ